MSFESSKKTLTQKLTNKSPKSHTCFECFLKKLFGKLLHKKKRLSCFFKEKWVDSLILPLSREGFWKIPAKVISHRDRHGAFEFVTGFFGRIQRRFGINVTPFNFAQKPFHPLIDHHYVSSGEWCCSKCFFNAHQKGHWLCEAFIMKEETEPTNQPTNRMAFKSSHWVSLATVP